MPRKNHRLTVGGTVVTQAQLDAWNKVLEKTGLSYADAMRESMRLLCETHGITWQDAKIVPGRKPS